jgi:predicted RNase H-like HicB family nuclease
MEEREKDTTLHLHASITPDDGWYVAQCLEVDVTSQGETIDEALSNLREALELYFRDEPATRSTGGRRVRVLLP